jgi:hypothetical protein
VQIKNKIKWDEKLNLTLISEFHNAQYTKLNEIFIKFCTQKYGGVNNKKNKQSNNAIFENILMS